ncbi:MAG: hypothetical protein WBQ66_02325, partial [Blastocatellia bacterium]
MNGKLVDRASAELSGFLGIQCAWCRGSHKPFDWLNHLCRRFGRTHLDLDSQEYGLGVAVGYAEEHLRRRAVAPEPVTRVVAR